MGLRWDNTERDPSVTIGGILRGIAVAFFCWVVVWAIAC
jgi:hypothetical protein